jgi:hypothetical protein
VKLISELLKAVRIVKMYAWERAMGARVDELRVGCIQVVGCVCAVGAVAARCWGTRVTKSSPPRIPSHAIPCHAIFIFVYTYTVMPVFFFFIIILS